jgi:hypothetical protein
MYCDQASFRRVLILAMTTARSDQIPAVCFEQLDYPSGFHRAMLVSPIRGVNVTSRVTPIPRSLMRCVPTSEVPTTRESKSFMLWTGSGASTRPPVWCRTGGFAGDSGLRSGSCELVSCLGQGGECGEKQTGPQQSRGPAVEKLIAAGFGAPMGSINRSRCEAALERRWRYLPQSVGRSASAEFVHRPEQYRDRRS